LRNSKKKATKEIDINEKKLDSIDNEDEDDNDYDEDYNNNGTVDDDYYLDVEDAKPNKKRARSSPDICHVIPHLPFKPIIEEVVGRPLIIYVERPVKHIKWEWRDHTQICVNFNYNHTI